MGARLPGNVMSFKRFMLRTEVLKLYRDFLKTLRKVSNEGDRRELREWVRQDFKRHKDFEEEEVIRMMLTKGKKSLEEIKNTIALSA